jgi:hypothetical protein
MAVLSGQFPSTLLALTDPQITQVMALSRPLFGNRR